MMAQFSSIFWIYRQLNAFKSWIVLYEEKEKRAKKKVSNFHTFLEFKFLRHDHFVQSGSIDNYRLPFTLHLVNIPYHLSFPTRRLRHKTFSSMLNVCTHYMFCYGELWVYKLTHMYMILWRKEHNNMCKDKSSIGLQWQKKVPNNESPINYDIITLLAALNIKSATTICGCVLKDYGQCEKPHNRMYWIYGKMNNLDISATLLNWIDYLIKRSRPFSYYRDYLNLWNSYSRDTRRTENRSRRRKMVDRTIETLLTARGRPGTGVE